MAIRKRCKKTAVLTLGTTNKPLYTIHNVSIVNCRSYSDLGIKFHPSLHFSEHIGVFCISRILGYYDPIYGAINRISLFITNNILAIRKAYISYARLHIEYTSTIGNPGLDARKFK